MTTPRLSRFAAAPRSADAVMRQTGISATLFPGAPELGGRGGFSSLALARGRWSRCAVLVELPASWENGWLSLWAELSGVSAFVAEAQINGTNLRRRGGLVGDFWGWAFQSPELLCDAWEVRAQADSAAPWPASVSGGTISLSLWSP